MNHLKITFSMPMRVVGLIFLITAWASLLARAERIDKGYLHASWQYEEGLPQNVVQAIIQTRDGYLWVGTQRGLARFDGVRFTHFDPSNTPELKSFQFTAFCETKDGSLWIGTDDGLNCLKDGKFTRYSKEDGLAGNQIRSLIERKDGSLWIGTVTGISYFENGKFNLFKAKGWRKDVATRSVFEDQDGVLWFGTSPTGLFRWKGGVLTSFDHTHTTKVWGEGKGILNDSIRVVWQDRRGNLWVGGGLHSGLTLFREGNCRTFFKSHGLADNIITAIFDDREGNLWVGSYGGLNRLDAADLDRLSNSKLGAEPEPEPFFHLEMTSEGVPYDLVNCISQDREGNIWAGSKDGLNRLKPRRFGTYTRDNGLTHNNVTSVYEDKEGTVWIGTWGGGLNRLKNGSFTNFASVLVLGLCDSRNDFWFGADYDSGLFQLNHETERWEQWGKTHGLRDSAVRVIHRDRKENMWLGTTTALVLFRNGKFTRFTSKEGLAGNTVRAITENDTGLWIGTSGGLTLRKWGETNFTAFSQGLSTNVISGLYSDQQQNLWIATLGGGLNRYKDGKFTAYTTKDGLFKDEIFEIVEDDYGNLWMTSRFGIFRVSKKELDDFDQGRMKTIASISYGKHDGMVSLECSAVAKPSAWKGKDGRLWFATAKGLCVIDPKENLKINETPPPVTIERVVYDGSPVDLKARDLRFLPGKGEMEFHFAALSYSAPLKNRFKYKLEGLDDDWNDAGARREIYYSKLSPGHYTFRVKACNNDGIWNETGTAFSFYLEPHFYQTSWFWITGSLVVVASGFGAYRLRIRQLKHRQKELQQLVDERTRNLQAEIAERQRVQLEKDAVHRQLLDISRKAGMAEVASGVLHNVGNALNSVNVSAHLISEQVRNTKLEGLHKVSALMFEQGDHLSEFVKTEKGQKLPAYLESLSQHLAEERKLIAREVEDLRKNVDHIKEIVAMQQSYAKVSGIIETVKISELVDDALRMNSTALDRHEVRVVQNETASTDVAVEKHKVLQILVNLISNAKEACGESKRMDKQIVLNTSTLNGSWVEIRVQDNGVGIPPENLTRIFSHGFTTRKNGHGFGLHTSALAAKEMGGSLKAYSDGLGKGATFVLQIPLKPNHHSVVLNS